MILPFYPLKLTFVPILLGQVSPPLKRFCLTVKFNLPILYRQGAFPTFSKYCAMQAKNPLHFTTVNNRMNICYCGCQNQWFIAGSGSGRWSWFHERLKTSEEGDLFHFYARVLNNFALGLKANQGGENNKNRQWQTAYPRSTLILTKVEVQKPI